MCVCVTEHSAECHLSYAVCVHGRRWGAVCVCVTEHGEKHHLPYAVCMEDGEVLRVYVCVTEHGASVTCHMLCVCMKDGGGL